ncbi:MAG: type I methionyl aminopeptidase [candidate division WOR-3 bacterium]|nr:type I methionyl aminopeptidase [candidate division WOR-3 bacterium]
MAILNDKGIKNVILAGEIINKIFKEIKKIDLRGMKTIELNDMIHEIIIEHNARPAFLNYRGFPKSACISLNDEVVHGIPDNRVIKDGDLVKIDIGVIYDGYIADAAQTFIAGSVSENVLRFVILTKEALKKGIGMAKAGNHVSDISRAIQTFIESNGYSVVRELTGHGVGRMLHEEPMIPNFVTDGPDTELAPGMALAIEPMTSMGSFEVRTARNGWTIMTRDGSLSSHFEDTIIILKKGIINATRVVEG